MASASSTAPATCFPADRTARPAATLLDHVLSGGAQCLGRPIGALQAGCRADIIVLDPDNPVIAGRDGDAIIDAWIFSGNQPAVRNVYVGGVQVVQDGRHFKQDDIFRRYRAALDRLRG